MTYNVFSGTLNLTQSINQLRKTEKPDIDVTNYEWRTLEVIELRRHLTLTLTFDLESQN